MPTTQISATLSLTAKARLDKVARMTGRSRQSIVEDAILREGAALEALPDEFIVPARVVLSEESARAILDRIDPPRQPGAALKRALRAAGVDPR